MWWCHAFLLRFFWWFVLVSRCPSQWLNTWNAWWRFHKFSTRSLGLGCQSQWPGLWLRLWVGWIDMIDHGWLWRWHPCSIRFYHFLVVLSASCEEKIIEVPEVEIREVVRKAGGWCRLFGQEELVVHNSWYSCWIRNFSHELHRYNRFFDMFWPFHFYTCCCPFFPSLNVFLFFVLFHVLWFYPVVVVPWSSLLTLVTRCQRRWSNTWCSA